MAEPESTRPLWFQLATAGGLSLFLGLIVALSPLWVQPPPQSTLEWVSLEVVAAVLGLLGIVGLLVAARLRKGGNFGGFVRAFAGNFPHSRYAQAEMNRAREQGPAPPRTKTK